MIICKTPREIEIMREAGRIVALTHQELKQTHYSRNYNERARSNSGKDDSKIWCYAIF